MTNDPLTTFRSEMPMPDEETTQRIYERATSGRRHVVTRRRVIAAVAVLAAAGIAGGLSATLGGGGSSPADTVVTGPHPGGPGGGMALAPVTMDTNYDNGELTSIDLTLRSVHPETTLDVKVVRSDAAQATDAGNASSQVVFDEQESPTVLDTTMQDATHATWSGTLTPSDWSGGCQTGLYRIEYSFGPEADSGSTDWFRCSQPAG
jgi:hypothetical protein